MERNKNEAIIYPPIVHMEHNALWNLN